ncbi:hypothetical protein GCM10027167_81680 [Nocardia heshunensis]
MAADPTANGRTRASGKGSIPPSARHPRNAAARHGPAKAGPFRRNAATARRRTLAACGSRRSIRPRRIRIRHPIMLRRNQIGPPIPTLTRIAVAAASWL